MNAVALMKEKNPFLWINPNKLSSDQSLLLQQFDLSDIQNAEARLERFAPLLTRFFPELNSTTGIIDSELIKIKKATFNFSNLYIKCDHSLAVSGSIKARGGFYAVFVIVERILAERGLDVYGIIDKSIGDIHSIFDSGSLVVGSTGNLGLSIGIMGRAFGFKVTVHMSVAAKAWKKEKLRNLGVTVIEYESDYSVACGIARSSANENKGIFFIDDENSHDLFLGYSAAASMLSGQLADKKILVDYEHPLFVYIPCGVGGAPGGITFGLKHIFGDNVHCFFAEPVEAPAMMLGLATGKNSSVTVRDIGLSLDTCADGLAVGTPSEMVAEMMSTILDGCFTVEDNEMLKYLAGLYDRESLRIEPSAAAGFAGPGFIANSKTGKEYLVQHKIDRKNITHIVWTTGGSMEPEEEYNKNYERGLSLLR